MRTLFWPIRVTLDALMEGPNRELDDTAQFMDQDFDRYASEMLKIDRRGSAGTQDL